MASSHFSPLTLPVCKARNCSNAPSPDDLLASSIVIVVRREHGDQGLRPQDLKFIEDTLKPQLEDIVEEQGGYATESKEHGVESNKSNISRIRTYTDKSIGDLLQSEDNKASLVIVELSTEFLDQSNAKTVESIENLLKKDEFKNRLSPVSISPSAASPLSAAI